MKGVQEWVLEQIVLRLFIFYGYCRNSTSTMHKLMNKEFALV